MAAAVGCKAGVSFRAQTAPMRRQNNILLTISLVWPATIAGAMIFVTADGSNFVHDIVGIERHLNRQTSQLGDCFIPRFAEGKGILI
jgi:hypothetical protein